MYMNIHYSTTYSTMDNVSVNPLSLFDVFFLTAQKNVNYKYMFIYFRTFVRKKRKNIC